MYPENRAKSTANLKKANELIGQKFGRLTVISKFDKDKRNNVRWLCRCECGTEKVILGHTLKNGQSTSCGCYRDEKLSKRSTTHGMSGLKLYKIWEGMIARCTIASSGNFHRYGGRGIKVHPNWRNFETFYVDMAPSYQKGLTLERNNVDGDYEKNNCCWATPKVQANNRSNNHRLTLNGITATLSEWGSVSGISGKQIKRNLDKGWTTEEAIYNRRNLESNN